MNIPKITQVSSMHSWVEPKWAECLNLMGIPNVYYRKHRYVSFGGKYEMFYARLSRCDTYMRITSEVTYKSYYRYNGEFVKSILYSELCDFLYEMHGDGYVIDQFVDEGFDTIMLAVNAHISEHTCKNIKMVIKSYFENYELLRNLSERIGLQFGDDPEFRKVLRFNIT